MWKNIAELIRWVVMLNEDTRRNRVDIEQMQKEIREMRDEISQLALDVRLLQATQKRDYDNLILQLDNVLLQFSRQLPPKQEK